MKTGEEKIKLEQEERIYMIMSLNGCKKQSGGGHRKQPPLPKEKTDFSNRELSFCSLLGRKERNSE